ncbi:MAG TPA: glutaredoxin family protein [Armatimonadota bacterium]|nr:glutaredoxin family protein [Armatimonadota bacterium]HOP79524.1 glutaredoxin family protein [Armatimonadota bacterium]HPP75669.1 glutaredoxin family protein [Armatimonadota bacterium]
MANEHNIIIYSTPTCPYCHQAKRYLAERGFDFTDKDVATDLQAREDMIRKSGQLGVPVIDVDGNIIIGFNRPKLDELLAE